MTQPISEKELDRILVDLKIWTWSKITCPICDVTHYSVHIVDTPKIECPNCHFMIGVTS